MSLLIASGSRKITALTAVSGISGSTAMPIVMGGNTVQISHEDFLTTNGLIAVLNQSNTFSGNNTFEGNQTILANGARTIFSGSNIDMFVEDSPNFDTFRVEVTAGEGLRMQDFNLPTETLNTFLQVGTDSGPITIFRNTTIDGNLQVNGNLIATQYIVSSSVSHITSSFSSGSTIFGDTADDRHQFTGSVLVSGGVTAPSFTGSLSYDNITDKPTLVSSSIQIDHDGTTNFVENEHIDHTNVTITAGNGLAGGGDISTNRTIDVVGTADRISVSTTAVDIASTYVGQSSITTIGTVTAGNVTAILPNGTVSGSSQVSFDGIVDKPTLFSSSIQVNADTITNFDTNVLTYIDSIGVISGSSQVSFDGIVDKPTLVSSSQQVLDYGIFATTGSNTFVGNQTIDGTITATTFTGSFVGDGSGLTGITAVTAGAVDFDDITNKPTLFSSSIQVNADTITNFDTNVKDKLNEDTVISGSSQVSFDGIVDKPTLVSSSVQVSYPDISNIPNGVVSSSQQVLDYDVFATTGSNTFIGNQIISGSVDVTGSLDVNDDVKIENGYVVLTRVSQSLEFANDTDAAAGGVPLGGLYRSGNFILIRLV